MVAVKRTHRETKHDIDTDRQTDTHTHTHTHTHFSVDMTHTKAWLP